MNRLPHHVARALDDTPFRRVTLKPLMRPRFVVVADVRALGRLRRQESRDAYALCRRKCVRVSVRGTLREARRSTRRDPRRRTAGGRRGQPSRESHGAP